MTEEKYYTITLNHKQLRILEDSLELHSRLSIGQIWIISDFLNKMFYKLFKKKDVYAFNLKEQYTDPMTKDLFGFDKGASFGITSDEIHPDGKVAYEMQKIMQNTISRSENHQGFSVWKDKPLKLSDQPLITINEL